MNSRFRPVAALGTGVAASLLAFFIYLPVGTVALAAGVSDKSSGLPGMPPVTDPSNLYASAGPGMVSASIRSYPSRVYVPNTKSDTVDVIDPKTYKVVDHFVLPKGKRTGRLEPQHVVTSWDMKKLWVA